MAAGQVGLDRTVVVEHVAHQAGAARHRHEVGLEADQATRGNVVFQPGAALAVGFHVGQFAATAADFFHHAALVFVFQVDGEVFIRLALLAVDFLVHHARLADGQLEAFAAHVFQQDGEVQFATAGDAEHVGVAGFIDAQRDVDQQFLGQAFADLAAGDELAFGAGQRRRVDHEVHVQRRFVHRQHRQADRVFAVADGDADADGVQPGNDDDVAGFGFFHRHAVQTLEAEHLVDAAGGNLVFVIHHHHRHAGLDAAVKHAANTETAGVGRIIERGDLQLQRRVRRTGGGGNVGQHGVEQRHHVGSGSAMRRRVLHVHARPAVEAGSVDDREVELLVGRAELVEQVEGLVDDPVRTRAGAVDLVDHDDGLEAQRQCLLGDKARLRHRAFDGVDQQHHAVDHAEHAFDLAAEVGVAGGVDDVDVVVAVHDGGVLRQDGDPALPFQIVGVHHPLVNRLVVAEGAGLFEELVDQRGFAMVDVRDDGDVAELAGHDGGRSAENQTL